MEDILKKLLPKKEQDPRKIFIIGNEDLKILMYKKLRILSVAHPDIKFRGFRNIIQTYESFFLLSEEEQETVKLVVVELNNETNFERNFVSLILKHYKKFLIIITREELKSHLSRSCDFFSDANFFSRIFNTPRFAVFSYDELNDEKNDFINTISKYLQ